MIIHHKRKTNLTMRLCGLICLLTHTHNTSNTSRHTLNTVEAQQHLWSGPQTLSQILTRGFRFPPPPQKHVCPSKNHVWSFLPRSLKRSLHSNLNPWSESENKNEKVREQRDTERREKCATERQTERMRWDYRDNASRWREVVAPAGLSTPDGLKDFSRATNNRTDDAFLTLETLRWSSLVPNC